MYEQSKKFFEHAKNVIPGGVNSPVRAFKSVGGTPIFMKSAKGAYLYDVDGNRYIDYINSWGPMILGHAYEPVIKAIQEYAGYSTSFGAPTELETKIAELIVRMVPNIEMVRMVNSGTEACMSAMRVARGYTGRNKFIKFTGNYHGHADAFLVNAGSGVATLGIQSVPGVTQSVAEDTLTVPYNNLPAVENLVKEYPDQIAAIIVEPVAGNMGCILPQQGFLDGLRYICDEHNILLIFDEVMTGFRLARGGAQELFNIKADLVTFGKIIGAGMPVGAFAGRKEIMENVAPAGKVYQAGTLSGNPIAMIAGYTLLQTLNDNPDIYRQLAEKTAYLSGGLQSVLNAAGIVHQVNSIGSMLSVHFAEYPIIDFDAASGANNELFKRFFHTMLEKGIYLPPSAFESWFVSNALTIEDLDETIAAAKSAIASLK
ncbi:MULTISPECIES: glutamate-1-semialdehyde 2,1-aminomutase [unclassified Chitinophaga]|uniref:glutamate-1-semialdehyde 2,1-aminomutase n=1 Tax=unclassified Chitinophaga TaxID=2619133 RepID=UPI0009CED80F|nr:MULTISPECIES: glutamate-1-semialdehyde 2,1-aminomutase [unclassified Chitinophaga]OMP80228.1 glutamate-1-semialdehyde-2,1-aminomutase [[Flexibacter] sp. ATCC 35208]WPV66787.1 glutamate-1-semialdehyde 2,1-aminomutase [Chitinophaga sp. LS1]